MHDFLVLYCIDEPKDGGEGRGNYREIGLCFEKDGWARWLVMRHATVLITAFGGGDR